MSLKKSNVNAGPKVTYVFVGIIIILLILIISLLHMMGNMNVEKKIVNFPGTQKDLAKRNCDTEMVYSVEDSQCELMCDQPGIFVSKNGACVNILSFNQKMVENKCDPKKGVLSYLIGDPQFGKTQMICLSIDLGIQPDNIDEPNKFCNGEIEINYLKAFPQLSSCKCPDNQILTIIPSTSTIRTYGACVSKHYYNIYDFNKLIYKPDKV